MTKLAFISSEGLMKSIGEKYFEPNGSQKNENNRLPVKTPTGINTVFAILTFSRLSSSENSPSPQ